MKCRPHIDVFDIQPKFRQSGWDLLQENDDDDDAVCVRVYNAIDKSSFAQMTKW